LGPGIEEIHPLTRRIPLPDLFEPAIDVAESIPIVDFDTTYVVQNLLPDVSGTSAEPRGPANLPFREVRKSLRCGQ
jgi:hypothetical protein